VLARRRESFVLFKNFSPRTLDRRRPLWKLAGEGKGALSCFHCLRAGFACILNLDGFSAEFASSPGIPASSQLRIMLRLEVELLSPSSMS
jgi:hypothetical protein